MFRLPALIYNNKLSLPTLPPPNSFAGKHILITGATSGLGFASAIHYANLGAASIIITARTLAKGLVAASKISAVTGRDIVKVMELDMSTFAGTMAFVDRVKSEVKQIDVVMLNAGILNTKFKMGEEGYEETIQVNVLSTALLALEFLPWMKSLPGKEKHIGFVTSGMHRGVKIREEDGWPQESVLQFWSQETNWGKVRPMYDVSKLLEIYVVNELAKLSRPAVIVNGNCPGLVKSDLARDYKSNVVFSVGIEIITSIISKSTEGGARTLVLASMATPKENGKYITHYQSDEDYKKAVEHNILGPKGQNMQAQVWKEVLDVLEKNVPGVKKIARPI